MFGTLKPKSLSGCARGRYQSSFCGSCHAMAEQGRLWALATGYDIAFLHLVMADLEQAPVQRLSCTALPFRKLPVRRLKPESRRWLSAINMLLIEAKCRDDVQDDGALKARLGLKLVKNEAARARKVLDQSGFSWQELSTLSVRQTELEQKRLALEQYALPTSLLLGEIFAHAATLTQRADFQSPMRQLGQGLGAAIYIKDATDDLENDLKKGRFNALSRGKHDIFYARTALAREVERARLGLAGMGLARSEAAIVLKELLPVTTSRSVVGRRRRIAGYCDCCGACCEVGFCCDAGACDACGSCGVCPCDCCAGCGNTSGSTTTQVATTTAASVPQKPFLHCPACGANLQSCDLGKVEVDECTSCNGLWLDHGELEELATAKKLPPRLLTSKKAPTTQLRPEGTRPCPRCNKMLLGTLVKRVRLDICPDCQGLWLDQGELNQILESKKPSP